MRNDLLQLNRAEGGRQRPDFTASWPIKSQEGFLSTLIGSPEVLGKTV